MATVTLKSSTDQLLNSNIFWKEKHVDPLEYFPFYLFELPVFETKKIAKPISPTYIQTLKEEKVEEVQVIQKVETKSISKSRKKIKYHSANHLLSSFFSCPQTEQKEDEVDEEETFFDEIHSEAEKIHIPKREKKLRKRREYSKKRSEVKGIRCVKQLIEETPIGPLKMFIQKMENGPYEEEIQESSEEENICPGKLSKKNRKKMEKIQKSTFDLFRYDFYQKNKQAIWNSLTGPNKVRRVTLAPIEASVQNRFMNRLAILRKNLGIEGTLTYHGTNRRNFSSICQKGFLIPGGDHPVVNGSAYGVGIYTSRTADYSTGYAVGCKTLFVCAVLDDANPPPSSIRKSVQESAGVQTLRKNKEQFHKQHKKPSIRRYSNNSQRSVELQSSKNVKNAGNICVLFDPSYVTPLFYMDYEGNEEVSTAIPKQLFRKVKNLKRKLCRKLRERRTHHRRNSLLYTTRNISFWM